MSTDKFTATRKAIKAWDKHEATFDAMVDSLDTGTADDRQDVADSWFAEQDRLKLEVGKEFVAATSDINSADKAKFVDVHWAKQQSGYSPKVNRPLEERRADYVRLTMGQYKLEGIPITEEKAGAMFDRIHGMGGK